LSFAAIYSLLHNPSKSLSLISGGGAGHEPAHSMYVGPGMLSAAVSGNIFASPSVPQISRCIRNVTGPHGTLVILKNYTGDIFHFQQAAQKLRAENGIRVEIVVVADDASLGRSKVGKVGRRGLAGTVLMHKIIGAMVSIGKQLEQCLAMASSVNSGMATVAASLDRVHIPGQTFEPELFLPQGKIELGMGIHNEPGALVLSPQPTLPKLVDSMLAYILDNSDEERNDVTFSENSNVILLVNNLGSLSVLEVSAITTIVLRQLSTL